MDTYFQAKIDQLISKGYSFNMITYLTLAWKNFGKEAGLYILYLITYVAITSVISIIPIISIVNIILAPLLVIGFALAAHKIQNKATIGIGVFFDGFNKRPGDLLLASLVSILLIFAMCLPLILILFLGLGTLNFFESGVGIEELENVSTAFGIFMALAIIITLAGACYITIAWSWAPYFIVFKNFDFWTAMETSRKVIHKKWWSFFGLYIVLGFINLLGVLICCIGLLITAPLYYITTYIAFEQIIGLNQFDEIATIGRGIEHENHDTDSF